MPSSKKYDCLSKTLGYISGSTSPLNFPFPNQEISAVLNSEISYDSEVTGIYPSLLESTTKSKHKIVNALYKNLKSVIPPASNYKGLFKGILKAFLFLENRQMDVKELTKVVIENRFAQSESSTPHQSISAALSLYFRLDNPTMDSKAILRKQEIKNKTTKSRIFWSLNPNNQEILSILNLLKKDFQRTSNYSFEPSSVWCDATITLLQAPTLSEYSMTSPTSLEDSVTLSQAPISPETLRQTLTNKYKRKYIENFSDNNRMTRQRTREIIKEHKQLPPILKNTNEEIARINKINKLCEQNLPNWYQFSERHYLLAGIKGLLMVNNRETGLKDLADVVMNGQPQDPTIVLYIGMCRSLVGIEKPCISGETSKEGSRDTGGLLRNSLLKELIDHSRLPWEERSLPFVSAAGVSSAQGVREAMTAFMDGCIHQSSGVGGFL
ncbi:9895_t:CDS:2 [Ambispora gerdemannii]|uniref:9895_t:CDS:1 n=1 Tax=Ambispora gerdemannii TaxID=144530 RepID=A0A9N9G0U5_9GLOM|nr:9895_t:CDS:2 [Ambispora gerdemannii]